MANNAPDLKIYRSSGEWSALYQFGRLVTSGDHYLVEEKAMELAGIDIEESADFLRGGNYKEDVANTVQEIAEYRRSLLENEVAELRTKAEALRAQADRLERSYTE